jgi:hypothetical protein
MTENFLRRYFVKNLLALLLLADIFQHSFRLLDEEQ